MLDWNSFSIHEEQNSNYALSLPFLNMVIVSFSVEHTKVDPMLVLLLHLKCSNTLEVSDVFKTSLSIVTCGKSRDITKDAIVQGPARPFLMISNPIRTERFTNLCTLLQ